MRAAAALEVYRHLHLQAEQPHRAAVQGLLLMLQGQTGQLTEVAVLVVVVVFHHMQTWAAAQAVAVW
jgi:hypothetical protein